MSWANFAKIASIDKKINKITERFTANKQVELANVNEPKMANIKVDIKENPVDAAPLDIKIDGNIIEQINSGSSNFEKFYGFNSSINVETNKQYYSLEYAEFDNISEDLSAQDNSASVIYFKPDGTKMYVSDNYGDIYQYTLSAPWDITTATYDNVMLSNLSYGNRSYGICFSDDGTYFYIANSDADQIDQYILSTAWDLSTATYDFGLGIGAYSASAYGVRFKPDGSIIYIADSSNNQIVPYSLSTPWNVTSASWMGLESEANFGEVSGLASINFNSDGTKLFLTDSSSTTYSIYQYTLSTPWDATTFTYDNISFNYSNEMTPCYSTFFKPDGTKMYLAGGTSIYQYDVLKNFSGNVYVNLEY